MVMRFSEDEFADLVHEAMSDIPPAFAQYLEDICIDVQAMPDAAACADGGVDDPRDLLGVYHGVPLTERSVEEPMRLPDRIVLFQRNIEDMGRTRRGVIREIRKTVFHEVGHHFGLDEDELTELGYE